MLVQRSRQFDAVALAFGDLLCRDRILQEMPLGAVVGHVDFDAWGNRTVDSGCTVRCDD